MLVFYALSGASALAFVIGTVRERRRFRNAVFLGLALVCLGLGLLGELSRFDVGVIDVVTFTGFAGTFLAVLVLTVFLLANGVTMMRREGRRPAHLLSLLAGLACLALMSLTVFVVQSDDHVLGPLTVALLFVAAYLAFLFCSLLLYALVYARIGPRAGVDFVVVLGSGLIDGRVPPLLAGRLDRAIELRDDEIRHGGGPTVITSGGRGPDEPIAEAEAMARYLTERGLPQSALVREDRSTTTLENLTHSRRIMTERAPGYRCAVVTNDYHAFRAALMARRAGVNGHVVGARTARYYWPSATIREFVAVLAEHRALHLVLLAGLFTVGILLGTGR